MTDLLYTDIEESLRSSLRGALAKRLDPARVAALYDDPSTDVQDVWRLVAAELGLAGLLVPERLGGVGAGVREAAVVAEELGRTVAPVPFLTSAVVATTTLLAAEAHEEVGALAAAERTAALVTPWTARRPHVADGPVQPVAGALEADLLLALVGDRSDPELVLLERDAVRVEALTSLDASRPLARVELTGQGRVIARGDAARGAVAQGLAAGAAVLSSEQAGLAQHCLETTVEYVRTRVQFARPIGSFQALKHRLADLYLQIVQAQAAARYAADTTHRDDPDAAVARALAGSYCSDVAVVAAEEALQLHGGIGMTWEHPIHLYLKRAKSDQLACGTPGDHRADLGDLVGIDA